MSKSTSSSHPKYRPDIDGLRAIAVLSVVGYHAFPSYISGGFIGVDVFFVISGFLISTIIFKSLDNNNFSFTDFYARRIRRIFPALIFVLLFSYILGWFTLYSTEYTELGKHIAAGAAFIPNFIYWFEAGYFDSSSDLKPLLHLWSLGIEEQFYIIWPLLIWFFWKKVNPLLIIIIVISFSFYLNITGVKNDPVGTFYSPQTRFWELVFGSLLAWLTLYKNINPSQNQSNFLSITSLVLLGYGFFYINTDFLFPGGWALIPVISAIMIIAAGPKAIINRTVLSNRVFVWFGLISYPLYLWHWPLLSFARIISSGVPSREIRVAAVVISIFLAWITYYFIEKKFRKNHNKKRTLLLVFILMIIGVIGYTTYTLNGVKSRKITQETLAISEQLSGSLWQYHQNDICLSKYPFTDSANYNWWFCIANNNKKPTILLLGNSYANHLYPGLANNQQITEQTILSIGNCGAEWANEATTEELAHLPCSGSKAMKQMELINTIISNEKSINYVIIGGIHEGFNSEYIEKLKKRIDFIEKNNARVIVFMPHVTADYDIKGCFSRPLSEAKQSCEIKSTKYKEIIENFSEVKNSILKTNPSVLFFDPNQMYCNTEKCSFIIDNLPLFRDEYSHFSEYASQQLGELFTQWAKENAPELLSKP